MVYNVNAKNWIAPSEPVDDIEQGKDRAAEHARVYLRKAATFRTTVITMEEIPLGVVSAALIHALSNPANQFFLSLVVLVRQVAMSLKEIT